MLPPQTLEELTARVLEEVDNRQEEVLLRAMEMFEAKYGHEYTPAMQSLLKMIVMQYKCTVATYTRLKLLAHRQKRRDNLHEMRELLQRAKPYRQKMRDIEVVLKQYDNDNYVHYRKMVWDGVVREFFYLSGVPDKIEHELNQNRDKYAKICAESVLQVLGNDRALDLVTVQSQPSHTITRLELATALRDIQEDGYSAPPTQSLIALIDGVRRPSLSVWQELYGRLQGKTVTIRHDSGSPSDVFKSTRWTEHHPDPRYRASPREMIKMKHDSIVVDRFPEEMGRSRLDDKYHG